MEPAAVRVLSLFSGIGGLDLGLEEAGMTVVAQSEIDEYASRVLAKHWPDVPNLGDIKQITEADLEQFQPIDLVCGGFPCQPVSVAGKQRAQADERWLWPELFRLVRLVRPRYVVLENVPGLLANGMGDVLGDIHAGGYDAVWTRVGAAHVGAPHRRLRIFIVAYARQLALREQQPKQQPRSNGAAGSSIAWTAGEAAYPESGEDDGARRPGVQPDLGSSRQGDSYVPCDACGEPWCRRCELHEGLEEQPGHDHYGRPANAPDAAVRPGELVSGGPGDAGGSRTQRPGNPANGTGGHAPDPLRLGLAVGQGIRRHNGAQQSAAQRGDGIGRRLADAFRSGPPPVRLCGPGTFWEGFPTQPGLRCRDDGLPAGVARARLKAIGNAVVPQVAAWVGRCIVEADR